MTPDTSIDEARSVWQSQRREHPNMSTQEVRMKAQAAHAKVQRNLIVAIVLGFVLVTLCITIVVDVGNMWFRLIAASMTVVTVLIAYTAYKRFWPLHTLSPNAVLKGCVEFYRGELRAQYRAVALWWRFLVPIIIFVFIRWNSLVQTRAEVPRRILPFLLILILVLRRSVARTFRHKIAALSTFEQEAPHDGA